MSERYGKYELLRRLATGGMAQIYLARLRGIEGFERLCVVKRILPHLAENDDFIRMFLHEARIAARLNHPNIVQIYDLGQQEESYFIAMEFIHGEDLRRIWKRASQQGRELPIPFVLRTIADAAAGLDYAHKKVDPEVGPLNIVHRDISPQNILVSFEGQAKVVDFGIAKAADADMNTRSGVLKGKYSYMSPEQATGSRGIDHRSDLFALGVVLYELLTGTRLFKRSNDIQTLNAVMECAIVPPSGVNARIPADLDPVVMKALTKAPDDRYPDARGLQLALEEWLVSHAQPASSAHVSQFMSELYADRLAAESRSGLPVQEDTPESRSAEEELSPRRRTAAPRTSRTAQPVARERTPSPPAPPVPVDPEPGEATTSLRPEREKSSSRAPSRSLRPPTVAIRGTPPARTELPPESNARAQATEVSRTTAEPRRLPLTIALSLGLAALIVGAAVWWTRPAPSGQTMVRVQTEPEGATLVFDGRTVAGVTPIDLQAVTGGTHTLLVGMPDYRDKVLSVTVPDHGEVAVPTILLEPLEPKPAQALAHSGDQGGQAAPSFVALTLDTVPSGAQLIVDGQARGLSPAVVRVPAGTKVKVRAELAGYAILEKDVSVRHGPEARERLVLERRRQQVSREVARDVAHAGGSREVKSQVEQDPPPQPRAPGTVRFAIAPIGTWADVSCGSYHFGPTPFPDKQVPAGVYDCTFTNPDFGTRHQRVEVRPGELSKVIVELKP